MSVIVATYSPGQGLDRLIASLDDQTLPQSAFEVVFVDDGSPLDTWSQLESVRDSHPNVAIERIPHSGWPSRPRNVGMDMARGEHVIFVDHDDEVPQTDCVPRARSRSSTTWTSPASRRWRPEIRATRSTPTPETQRAPVRRWA